MHFFQFKNKAEQELLYAEENKDKPVIIVGTDFDEKSPLDRQLVDSFRFSSSTHGGPVELSEDQFEKLRQLIASKTS